MVYTLDALGRRVKEDVNATYDTGTDTELYYSAGWQVLEERQASAAKYQNVWSPVYVDALLDTVDGTAAGSLDTSFDTHGTDQGLTRTLVDVVPGTVSRTVVEGPGFDDSFLPASIWNCSRSLSATVRTSALFEGSSPSIRMAKSRTFPWRRNRNTARSRDQVGRTRNLFWLCVFPPAREKAESRTDGTEAVA